MSNKCLSTSSPKTLTSSEASKEKKTLYEWLHKEKIKHDSGTIYASNKANSSNTRASWQGGNYITVIWSSVWSFTSASLKKTKNKAVFSNICIDNQRHFAVRGNVSICGQWSCRVDFYSSALWNGVGQRVIKESYGRLIFTTFSFFFFFLSGCIDMEIWANAGRQ